MAYLSLVLLSLACFAGDVVELEPVSAWTDNFLCSQYTTPALCSGHAAAKAYCWYNGSNCVDDPQLRVLQEGDDTSSGSCGAAKEGVDGQVLDLTDSLKADCKEVQGTGKICAKFSAVITDFNYCILAWLRDNTCPASLCMRNTANSYAGDGKNQCIPNNIQECPSLSTSTECGLVPKCYWTSNRCEDDPCWAMGALVSGYTCEGLQVTLPNTGTPVANECKLFQPWISGAQKDYCVHKSQSNPNICYFGTPGATTGAGNDYGASYPKFNVTTDVGSVTCTGTAASCVDGECYTTINTGGALAGQYCTDGTHGDASILRIPTMVVFFIVSALSLFIL